MLFYPDERTSLFIDGYQFHNTCRSLNIDVDFGRLYKFFSSKLRLVHAHFYTTVDPNPDDPTGLRPLLDWLAHNGYMVTTKPRRVNNIERTKVDMEIAVDVMRAAMTDIDHIVLFSGDSAFLPLIKAVQDMGRRFTVISTIKTKPAPISDEMRKQVNNFVDIEEIAEHIRRKKEPVNV